MPPLKTQSAQAVLARKPFTGLVKEAHLRLVPLQWMPSGLLVFRILIFVRFIAAMYSVVTDCDEVFNYWEGLHYLEKGAGFQTWEYSSQFALRSYWFLLLHRMPTFVASLLGSKRPAFFALRIAYAFATSALESRLYLATRDHISPRIARYLLFFLIPSAAFWTASVSFLPSSFALLAAMAGQFFALRPVESGRDRIMGALLSYAVGAVWGWPFAALLAVPIVFEHICIRGSDRDPSWRTKRVKELVPAVLACSALALPMIAVDSLAYGRLVLVPLNLLKYNLLPGSEGGPTLYGTEGPLFYIKNAALAFNVVFLLAAAAIPVTILTYLVFDPKRFGDERDRVKGSTHPVWQLCAKLLPPYIWTIVLSLQPHKEERFLYPAYGHIIFNAAVTLGLLRGWMEQAYIRSTNSPYKARQTSLFSTATRFVIVLSAILSLGRIAALTVYYRAPMQVYTYLTGTEIPRLALSQPILSPENTRLKVDATLPDREFSRALEDAGYTVDLSDLHKLDLTLCVGKEWHRYPSSYFVPDVLDVQWIRSDFDGILPRRWDRGHGAGLFGRRTAEPVASQNSVNKFESDRFVDIKTCDYLVDLDFPHRQPTELEPRYVGSPEWEARFCARFLAASASGPRRWLLLPLPGWEESGLKWGDYCLLKRVHRK